jgi:hypothetical protein
MNKIMLFVRIALSLIFVLLAISAWPNGTAFLYLLVAAVLWVIFGGWEPSGL